VDWDNGRSGEFTRLRWDERQAMIVIVAAYMTGELDADDAAAVLRCDVTDLPPLPGAGSREESNVLHLGLAYSTEDRDSTTDGRGIVSNAAARFRARPEGGLTTTRLVDTGEDRSRVEFAAGNPTAWHGVR